MQSPPGTQAPPQLQIAVVREDPPAIVRRARTSRFAAALEEVKATPGEWFRVATFPKRRGASSAASTCKKAFTGFEFTARKHGAQGSALFAKFVGGKKA